MTMRSGLRPTRTYDCVLRVFDVSRVHGLSCEFRDPAGMAAASLQAIWWAGAVRLFLDIMAASHFQQSRCQGCRSARFIWESAGPSDSTNTTRSSPLLDHDLAHDCSSSSRPGCFSASLQKLRFSINSTAEEHRKAATAAAAATLQQARLLVHQPAGFTVVTIS